MTIRGICIDDDSHWRDRLPPRLARHDVDLVSFAGLDEAAGFLREHSEIQFVLSDYRFRDLPYNGEDIVLRLQAEFPERRMKYLLMSVLSRSELNLHGEEIPFISKSSTSNSMVQVIRAVLFGRGKVKSRSATPA